MPTCVFRDDVEFPRGLADMQHACSGKLELSLRRAKRHGVKYGVKLVRGAYLVQETKLAEERGYPSPIWPKIQDTHDNYHACMRKLLDNLDIAEFMVASHNEDSVRLAIAEMAKRGIDPESTFPCTALCNEAECFCVNKPL